MKRSRIALIASVGLHFPACLGSEPIDLGARATDANADTESAEAPPSDTPPAEVPPEEVADVTPEEVAEVADDPACTAIWPPDLDFGGTAIGTCTTHDLHLQAACANGAAKLTAAALSAGSDPAFELPSPPAAGSPIGPNGLTLSLTYCPSVPSSNTTGTLTLAVAPADAAPDDPRTLSHAVALRGRSGGLLAPCPTIGVTEGDTVSAPTKLHLIGSDPAINEATFQWSVDAPPGSASGFFPTANVADPTYEANVVGIYRFHLTVTDANGGSCTSDKVVRAISDQAIHVELLWHTPGDPNESDEGPAAGSDLDLHVAHPFASGPDLDLDGAPDPWYDEAFDCFAFNENPDWGSLDPATDDNPVLDRDDTDGAGPETFSLAVPERVCYRIGVHAWSDYGFGASFATVRVFLDGILAFEAADVRLDSHDLWTVTDLCWPSAAPPTLTRVCAGTTTACTSDAECAPATCGPRIARGSWKAEFGP